MFGWGGKREEPKFPDRRSNGEYQADEIYEESLRQFATRWVEYYIHYYKDRASLCRFGSYFTRSIALGGIVLGGTILVCRALSVSNQKWLMQHVFGTTLTEVPAEIGLVLFALAAGVIAVDRFANISENWMRYIVAMLTLRRMLVEFQLAGVSLSAELSSTNQKQPDRARVELERLKGFLTSVFDVVQRETQEWADSYRKNRSELEGYLKVQEAALRDKKKKKPGSAT